MRGACASRDRDRQRVVRVVLVRLGSSPTPAPATPTSPAHPALAHRHATSCWPTDTRARSPTRSPTSAPRMLAAQPSSSSSCEPPARTCTVASGCSSCVDHHRRVRPLVRIDTDHHRHLCLPQSLTSGVTGWALLIPEDRARAPLSSHTPAVPAGQHLDRKPVGHSDGRQFENHPTGPTTLRAPQPRTQSGRYALSVGSEAIQDPPRIELETATRRRRHRLTYRRRRGTPQLLVRRTQGQWPAKG